MTNYISKKESKLIRGATRVLSFIIFFKSLYIIVAVDITASFKDFFKKLGLVQTTNGFSGTEPNAN